MAIDKSTWNKKQKVTQHTIDSIKRLGMTKALDLAKMNSKAYQAGLVAEYQEATRRLYGDRRFTAATGVAIPKPKKVTNKTTSGGGKYIGSTFVPNKPSKPSNPKQADKAASTKASTKYSPTPYKAPAKKKNNNTALKVAGTVAGTVAAAGLLIASRGRAAGVATRLAPGLMKNKYAQAALTGEIKKVAPKVAAKASTKASTVVTKAKDAASVAAGRAAARAGKPVSQSQYDAMVAAAKARGISTVAKKAAAKKATTTAVKKTAAKKVVKKAAAPAASKAKTAVKKLSAGKRWDANAPK
jgi:hypothetical protein